MRTRGARGKRRAGFRGLAVAVLVFSLVIAGCLANCSGGASGQGAGAGSYDWSGLQRGGEHLTYWEDGQLRSRWGVDVSEHQEDIAWDEAAAAGVQFAFVRIGNRGATEGVLDADKCFYQNAVRAQEAGIEVHAYFFSQAVTADEAREEAAFALEQVREVEAAGVKIGYVAYDHEAVEVEGARANGLSAEQLAANTQAFCEAIAAAGYAPMVYGNRHDLERLAPEVREQWLVWLAQYEVDYPTAPFGFVIWQYSNTGSVPGISIDVDLNLWLEPK